MLGRVFASFLALALLSAIPANAADAPAAKAALPDLATLKTAIVGTWQSTDDPKFSRELAADGQAIDRYEGDESATARGHWLLFLGSAPPAGTTGRTFQRDVFYLRLDENGDVLLFALAGLSRSDMKMVYLERGNLLSFVRLK
ncbi:MAG TPA: hypothetical protein VKB71_02525 [Rhizomicrobium sp.]|nr:hypothetical protein [Rhizomicrobium sp.]